MMHMGTVLWLLLMAKNLRNLKVIFQRTREYTATEKQEALKALVVEPDGKKVQSDEDRVREVEKTEWVR